MTETLAQFANDLKRSAQELRDTTPVMEKCAVAMADGCKKNIAESHDPEGQAYAALKWRDGKPLLDAGNLYLSILPSWTKSSANAGTDVEYAWVHNEGCLVPEKSRAKPWVFDTPDGRTVFTTHIRAHEIPQREFVGWGEPLIGTIEGLVGDFAIDALGVK